jgi:hypothetical protein
VIDSQFPPGGVRTAEPALKYIPGIAVFELVTAIDPLAVPADVSWRLWPTFGLYVICSESLPCAVTLKLTVAEPPPAACARRGLLMVPVAVTVTLAL